MTMKLAAAAAAANATMRVATRAGSGAGRHLASLIRWYDDVCTRCEGPAAYDCRSTSSRTQCSDHHYPRARPVPVDDQIVMITGRRGTPGERRRGGGWPWARGGVGGHEGGSPRRAEEGLARGSVG